MIIHNRLRNVANAQFGYFTAQQAIAAGYGKDRHSYHVLRGNWLKVDRALFRLHGYPDSMQSDFVRWSLWAIKRHGGKTVAVSHNSALAFYGLTTELPVAVHLTVPMQRHPREEKQGCVFYRRELLPHELCTSKGFLVTTVQRTLQDMKPDLILSQRWDHTLRIAVERGMLSLALSKELSQGSERLPAAYRTQQEQSAECAAGSIDTEGDVMRKRTPWFQTLRRGQPQLNIPNRSFTLVEMLVVIAIIMVLTGLLMPSLQRAVNVSRQAACANNLRQCGIGTTIYADNFHGYTISYDGSGRIASCWPDQLMLTDCLPDISTIKHRWDNRLVLSILPANNVFSCPSTPPPSTYRAAGTTFTGSTISSALSYGVRPWWSSYRYPNETMRARTGFTDLVFTTCNSKAPFLGDSIRLTWGPGPDGLPGQGSGLGFDQSTYFLNNAGNLYLGHGLSGNAWYSDGRVESKTAEGYMQMNVPWSSSPSPVLAYPNLN